MVAAVLVLGVLAGACGADIGIDDEPATQALSPRLDQEAMLNQVIAEVIRNNGPYTEAAVAEAAVAQAAVVQASLVPSWILSANGPYVEQVAANAWLVPPWVLDANGPYAETNGEEVPANVR